MFTSWVWVHRLQIPIHVFLVKGADGQNMLSYRRTTKRQVVKTILWQDESAK